MHTFELMSGSSAGVHSEISAIEGNDGAGDPAGGIGSEEDCESADVIGLSESSGGDTAEESGFKAGVIVHAQLEAGVDDLCGGDAVDSDPAVRPFGAEFACHLDDGTHRHAVCGMASAQSCGAGEGADIHNGTAALPEHAFAGFLAHGESANYEILEDFLEVWDGEFFGSCEAAVAGDVAEEIDA